MSERMVERDLERRGRVRLIYVDDRGGECS